MLDHYNRVEIGWLGTLTVKILQSSKSAYFSGRKGWCFGGYL